MSTTEWRLAFGLGLASASASLEAQSWAWRLRPQLGLSLGRRSEPVEIRRLEPTQPPALQLEYGWALQASPVLETALGQPDPRELHSASRRTGPAPTFASARAQVLILPQVFGMAESVLPGA